MPDIVLSTLNAKFIHAAFGLRYLLANLGDLRERAALAEFDLKQTPLEIVESLLALEPRLIGFGVYIWNVRQTHEVLALLKRLRPQVTVILGGPEVSYETEGQPIVALADYVIAGEADLAFADLCRELLASGPPPSFQIPDLSGLRVVPTHSDPGTDPGPPRLDGRGPPRPDSPTHPDGQTPPTDLPPRPPILLQAGLPDLHRVALPYDLYTDADLTHRVIYVEASRGCPFSCEFCLSSLDLPVRAFPLEPFLVAMEALLVRGARQFKFVDRTFNLNLAVSRRILRFFRERWQEGMLLHFEMIPDRLPAELREEIAAFPNGALQFEIGIQSFNEEVCARIQRRQDRSRTEANLRFLREHTGVHVHADLIAGLPGESLESFAEGFDQLLALGPHEIQVGILKRLRGTPISRHDAAWAMRYNPLPPYDLLENRLLDFATMQRLRRFARYWDLVANSGRFKTTSPLIWAGRESPFWSFLEFSDQLHARWRQTQGIAPDRLARFLFHWLIDDRGFEREQAADAVLADWQSWGRSDLPGWLNPSTPAITPRTRPTSRPGKGPGQRQARHRSPRRALDPPPASPDLGPAGNENRHPVESSPGPRLPRE